MPVFPTTIWTTIREAGEQDHEALERFAEQYRAPVLRYLRRRTRTENEAEDLSQEVFLRVLRGRVLERAEKARGRFRSLLLSVVRHTLQDQLRKRKEEPSDEIEIVERDEEFDREWVLEIVERALARLEAEGSPYHGVLRGHLGGEKQDRNKLWIARGKLLAMVRHEVALTCRSHEEIESEVDYLSAFLNPGKKAAGSEPGEMEAETS